MREQCSSSNLIVFNWARPRPKSHLRLLAYGVTQVFQTSNSFASSHLQTNNFLMAVVPTQQLTHNENEHAPCEVKLELKGHTAQVLEPVKKLLLN